MCCGSGRTYSPPPGNRPAPALPDFNAQAEAKRDQKALAAIRANPRIQSATNNYIDRLVEAQEPINKKYKEIEGSQGGLTRDQQAARARELREAANSVPVFLPNR